MPKIKQGRRHHHSASREKYYEHARKGPVTPLQDISNSAGNNGPISSLEHLKIPSFVCQLSQWHISRETDQLELSFLEGSAPSIVKLSVTVSDNLSWKARVYGRLVPSTNPLYHELSAMVTSVDMLIVICRSIQSMHICEGNGDDFFVTLVKGKAGGVVRRGDAISAYFDVNSNSVHHSECFLLRKKAGRCVPCQRYRGALRAMKSRSQKRASDSSEVFHRSHANYRYIDIGHLLKRI